MHCFFPKLNLVFYLYIYDCFSFFIVRILYCRFNCVTWLSMYSLMVFCRVIHQMHHKIQRGNSKSLKRVLGVVTSTLMMINEPQTAKENSRKSGNKKLMHYTQGGSFVSRQIVQYASYSTLSNLIR